MALPDDDSLVAEMIRTVRTLTERFEEHTAAGDRAYAELVEAWRIHREVVNRAIGYLNQEVIGFKDRIDSDNGAREKRQAQVDDTMQAIQDSQTKILQRQWLRMGVEVLLILLAIAYFIGRNL